MNFDPSDSSFIIGDVRLGPHTDPNAWAARSRGTLKPVEGHPGWKNSTCTIPPWGIFAAFMADRLHSGYFWYDGLHATDWNKAEKVEAQRRQVHENLMNYLFGALAYEDDRVAIRLLRDPRSYMEQIFFEYI